MDAKIQKWGNSLAVRIPKPFATSIGLDNGTKVDLTIEENRLIISKSLSSTPNLDELLSRITSENIHEEIDFGGPVGREAW